MTDNSHRQRRLILFNMMTLDGYFEGPNSDISWHNVDQEFNEFAIDQLNSVGVIIFGRRTYEGMASYWPTPIAIENDPMVASMMNGMPKIVVSKTLAKAEWNNTVLIKGDVAAEFAKLKQQSGQDLIIFGSANLAATLTKLGMIDEYRIMLNPVVTGAGTPLFQCVAETFKLILLTSRTFKSGNVLLNYAPVKPE